MTQHVVIVADVATNLQIIGAIVEDIPDATVHAFLSSREAMAWIDTNVADALLLDYHMPEPDGLALIRLLRSDKRNAQVPIVVVTAEHEHQVRINALAAGASDFIVRPIKRREVLSRLRALLSLAEARSGLVVQAGDSGTTLELEGRRAREQAERLAALWRVANSASDAENENALQAVLSEGAAAIRPGQPFFGTVMRVEGDDCVVVAVASPQKIEQRMPLLAPPGTRIPISDLAQQLSIRSGLTLLWDDVANERALDGFPRARLLGLHALACATFEVARSTYVVSFMSPDPTSDPFRPDDLTYVNLLADFFAHRFQQVDDAERLQHQMSHDSLTGLRNRTQFRLDARVPLALHGSGTTVIVSLDGFGGVNAAYGHLIGDALLAEVAAALAASVTGDDVVGRLTGDTFGVFLSRIGTEEQARIRLSKIADVFARPFSTGEPDGREFIQLSATQGAAISNSREYTFDHLLSNAETAAFAAKQRGRGNLEIYRPGMESRSSSLVRTATEISLGLERGEFELYVQPQIDLRTMAVTGAEALIRWNHPERGLVTPDGFIPFAERHGLIRQITRWVTASALDAAAYLRDFDPAFRLYFNLSALDFADPTVVDELEAAAEGGAALTNIGVELTETGVMQDLGTANRTVTRLQRLGVSVAIDDFGTGYSSLSLLKRLPVNIIKIDKSFVSQVLHSKRDAAIAVSIIAGGEDLAYETVAEGVETEEQLAWLRDHGCRYVQGYHIARPAPLDRFVAWLEARVRQAPVA